MHEYVPVTTLTCSYDRASNSPSCTRDRKLSFLKAEETCFSTVRRLMCSIRADLVVRMARRRQIGDLPLARREYGGGGVGPPYLDSPQIAEHSDRAVDVASAP